MGKDTVLELWKRRLFRLRRRAWLATADLNRSLSWHVGGGRRFFGRYATELIAGHKWCFVVGCNNSGTSLLQSMLEQTGQISTFRSEGQFYTRVMVRAERRGHERVWMEYVHDLMMSREDSTNDVPRLVHDWLSALSTPIHPVIVEKTPANIVRMEWLQNAFPRSYFIGLVRNGYAVSEGIRRKGNKSLERGARHWNEVNRTMLERAQNIDKFMQVRYEDLVDRYDEIMRELGQFLGLEVEATQFATCRNRSANIRQDHRTLRNYNAESISRLSEKDCRIIHDYAAAMLDHFGYTRTVEGISQGNRQAVKTELPRWQTD